MKESLIIGSLLKNEQYARRVIVFLKPDYFSGAEHTIFKIIQKFYNEYNNVPTKDVIAVELLNDKNISTDMFDIAINAVDSALETNNENDINWLVDQTEKFCQDKAIVNAIRESIQILNGSEQNLSKGAIPSIVSDALAVCFDSNIGHDFLEESDSRYEQYHEKFKQFSCDIDLLNTITNGGFKGKTLNVFMAGTGVGKSMTKCHLAACYLAKGFNVLYITLEMSEIEISSRIESNLMDLDMDHIKLLPKETYDKKISKLRDKCKGKLIVKEYPTSTANANHFRHLINELKLKRKFIPDILIVDYLNICSSARLKTNIQNSFQYVKAIAEELRALAQEFDVPVISSTQLNRTGFVSSDIGLEDTSESFGLAYTVDLMLGLVQTEELAEMNQILCKQLKNRYRNERLNRKFVIGLDKGKSKLYNITNSEYDEESVEQKKDKFRSKWDDFE